MKKQQKQQKVLQECKDINICYALGLYLKILHTLFHKFRSFDRVYEIERLFVQKETSINSVIHVFHSRVKQSHVVTLLKSVTNASFADNILYEYFVGRHVNTFTQAPNGIVTLNLFRYRSMKAYKEMFRMMPTIKTPQKQSISSILDKRLLRIRHVKNARHLRDTNLIQDSCKNHKRFAIEILFVPYSFPLLNALHHITFLQFHLTSVLFQTYTFLRIYQNVFTHRDLHSSNVILVHIPNCYFTFKYTDKKGKTLVFDSPYLVKLIDSSRSYSSNVSKHFKKVLCHSKECGECGLGKGYGNVAFKRNTSIDLFMMSILHETLYPFLKSAFYEGYTELKQLFDLSLSIEHVPLPKNHRTNDTEKTPIINTVEDIYHALWKLMTSFRYKNNSDTSLQRYGTFLINTRVVSKKTENKKKYCFVFEPLIKKIKSVQTNI